MKFNIYTNSLSVNRLQANFCKLKFSQKRLFLQNFEQFAHFFGIFDARSVFHAAGDIDQFGVEFFTNCKDVFGIYTARKPERQVARLLQKQRFGNGLARTAGDSLHLRVRA